MNITDYIFLFKLDNKHKLIVIGLLVLLVPMAIWIGKSIPTGSEGKIALRDACSTVVSPMSPKSLLRHFPEGSYTGRCLPETQQCGEFTGPDGHTLHFPCPAGFCTMYWSLDGWGCRVQLSERDRRARGPGELKGEFSDWHSLAE